MPEPKRDFAIYESIAPSRAHRYKMSEVSNANRPTTVGSADVGVMVWNSTHAGYNYWDGGNWRYPNGADGWKDTP